MSIYRFTKQKLISHGVQNSANGRVVLEDRQLFLLFVKLERARRLSDLVIIQSKIENIATYSRKIGKAYLKIYAFMYIRFSDFTPHITHLGLDLENGDVRYMKDYRRAVSQTEIAIGEWASAMYGQYERYCFNAIYLKDKE